MSEVLNEILNVQGLTVEYPGFTLGPCSFSMKRGEILAAAGESGSGKTTLARACPVCWRRKRLWRVRWS